MISEITKQGSVNITIFESKIEKGESMEWEEGTNHSESVKSVEKPQNTKEQEAYTAVNRDGDTLEISGETSSKKVINEGDVNIKIPDISLKNYTKEKLKMLLQTGKISKQQYDKAIKKAKV